MRRIVAKSAHVPSAKRRTRVVETLDGIVRSGQREPAARRQDTLDLLEAPRRGFRVLDHLQKGDELERTGAKRQLLRTGYDNGESARADSPGASLTDLARHQSSAARQSGRAELQIAPVA